MLRTLLLLIGMISLNGIQLSIAQPSPQNYQYCFCNVENPQPQFIQFRINDFDRLDIHKISISVNLAGRNFYDSNKIILTAEAPFPRGRIIHSDNISSNYLVNVNNISEVFIKDESSVSIYINLFQNREFIASSKPVTFYRSKTNVDAYCEKYCPPIKEMEVIEEKIKLRDLDPPVVRAFFSIAQIYPSEGARDLFKALNPNVDLNNPGNNTIIYPHFTKIPQAIRMAYENNFRKSQFVDQKLNNDFIKNVNEYDYLMELLYKTKMTIDPVIDITSSKRLSEGLKLLQQDLRKADTVIDRISIITNSALNEEITALNADLGGCIKNNRMTTELYIEIKALIKDLAFTLKPYVENTNYKRIEIIFLENKRKKEVKDFRGPNRSSVDEITEGTISETGEFVNPPDINPNERLYYIYVYRNEKENRLKPGEPERDFKVWYKPKAFANNDDPKHITDVGYASVTAKGLCSSLLVFYFKKEDKIYKSPVALDIENELDRDDDKNHPKQSYKLLFYLDDLKLVNE